MADYSDFLDYVLPDAPSCSQRLARDRIRLAAIEFCIKSKLYRSDFTMNLVAAQKDYVVAVTAGTVVSDVLRVKAGEITLAPATPSWLDENVTGWRTDAGATSYYYLPGLNDNTVRLVQTPEEAITNGLELTAALKPTLASTTCPDFLRDKYSEEIAHGALAKILAIAKKPWTDFGAAKYHLTQFNTAIGVADVEAYRSGTRQILTITTDY